MSSHRPRINKSKLEVRIGVQLTDTQVAMIVVALSDWKKRAFHLTPFGVCSLSDQGLKDCDNLLELMDSVFHMFPGNGKEA